MATAIMEPHREESPIERQSLCLSGPEPGIAIHAGEVGFKENLEKYFMPVESNTAERLVAFKEDLRTLDHEAFWNHLMEGMSSMCHAQFAFVSKRILVDDHLSAVEMPPLGEVGSCLMGVALYWNDGNENKNLMREYKYYAWNAPCSYMRHDKVFLCPEGLAPLVKDNPNQLPFECDAYLGVPLFAEGKCFAHFGLMWTKTGLEEKKNMSWGYVEMLLHALEDLITDRLTSGRGFAKSNTLSNPRPELTETSSKVIPQDAITAAQSLKPYARSLSHELRTPMQGVVGMLDVMYATVQDQLQGTPSETLQSIFQTLKENIETVQDSSKRAIEAADNVVHAYDLNMQIPGTPSHDTDSPGAGPTSYFDSRPKMIEGSNIVNPHKRKRSHSETRNHGSPPKSRQIYPGPKETDTPRSPLAQSESARYSPQKRITPLSTPSAELHAFEFPRPSLMTPADTEILSTPGTRQSNIRDTLPVVIQESLRVGGRPDSAISQPTLLGEKIEVRSRSSNGHASQKIVEWSVDPDVPDLVAIDERDLSKLVTAVLLNAIKFTENGTILLHARMSDNRKFVSLTVADTGSGIPLDFQPELFKPFAKEDHSITRTKEGLGLGLLVAKGLARRFGGDIRLLQSSTDEADHGTEFEICIPLEGNDRASRATTPFNSASDPGAARSAPRNLSALKPESPFPPSSPVRPSTPSLPTISKLISAVASSEQRPSTNRRHSAVTRNGLSSLDTFDKNLAKKYPLRFLVAEDNKINRKLLVNMLGKFGYKNVHEAYDGREAVRIIEGLFQTSRLEDDDSYHASKPVVDVILMDLWMPEMDGYAATEEILRMHGGGASPIVLAVSADVTEAAVDRATRTGMQGYMTKPYKLMDLQRLIVEFCTMGID